MPPTEEAASSAVDPLRGTVRLLVECAQGSIPSGRQRAKDLAQLRELRGLGAQFEGSSKFAAVAVELIDGLQLCLS